MRLTCHHYQLLFNKPLNTSKGSFEHREGLILAFQGHGQSFYGDAAPLPGFSDETLDDVVSQLDKLAYRHLRDTARRAPPEPPHPIIYRA
ncbi:MAG: hypothetical protein U5J63_02445 [Fodinibius sp.]|nr:hypothetical protein [Fodinibius sp.]